MEIHGQYVEKLGITRLKGLKKVDIDFSSDKRMIALMGVNGCGKSTVIHALSCCYRPPVGSQNTDYRFPRFFLPSPHGLWQGSKFTMTHTYSIRGKKNKSKVQAYGKAKDRWTPRCDDRPQRHIEYIGIDTCVPEIEIVKNGLRVDYQRRETTDSHSTLLKKTASYITGIQYQILEQCSRKGSRKSYIAVIADNDTSYSSLSMGAGEQRIFRILDRVLKAPKYSLILIDEIDLLLHITALKKLIERLSQIARDEKRQYQIVFTTHSMVMNELKQFVEIRYLIQTPEKTLVLDYITTDAIYYMIGKREAPINIHVEDIFSQGIIRTICKELSCKKNVDTYLFGAAVNVFTQFAGFILKGEDCAFRLGVIDGDVYISKKEKEARIKEVLTGNSDKATQQRETVLQAITQYNLPDDYTPERYIREMVIGLDTDVLPLDDEYRRALEDTPMTGDHQRYVENIAERIGEEFAVCLNDVLFRASKSPQWDSFVKPVKDWIVSRIEMLERT
ncbi:MAG: AAA family ATPase [Candidatus Limiplasma sp.]|nr:AAA family ATPase [Candidatus Limiplasma sp.]